MKTDPELRRFDWLQRAGFVIRSHVIIRVIYVYLLADPTLENYQIEVIYFNHFIWLSKIALFLSFGDFLMTENIMSGNVIILAEPLKYTTPRNNKRQYKELMNAAEILVSVIRPQLIGVVRCGR